VETGEGGTHTPFSYSFLTGGWGEGEEEKGEGS